MATWMGDWWTWQEACFPWMQGQRVIAIAILCGNALQTLAVIMVPWWNVREGSWKPQPWLWERRQAGNVATRMRQSAQQGVREPWEHLGTLAFSCGMEGGGKTGERWVEPRVPWERAANPSIPFLLLPLLPPHPFPRPLHHPRQVIVYPRLTCTAKMRETNKFDHSSKWKAALRTISLCFFYLEQRRP